MHFIVFEYKIHLNYNPQLYFKHTQYMLSKRDLILKIAKKIEAKLLEEIIKNIDKTF